MHIFENPDFKGDPNTTTDPISVQNVKQRGLPTSVGSIVVPDDCEVHLFRDTNYKGNHRYFRGPAHIRKTDHGSEMTSSLIVTRHASSNDEPKAKEAILYFNGRNGLEGVRIETPLEIVNVSKLGIPNNAVTQVKIGTDSKFVVFDNYNYEGASSTLAGPYTGGLGDLDKKVSSFKLQTKIDGKNMQEVSPIGSSVSNNVWIGILLLIIIILLAWYLLNRQNRRVM